MEPTDPYTLSKKYFVSGAGFDEPPPGESAPLQQSANEVTRNIVDTYVDGTAYFAAIDAEINTLLASTAGDRYFYMTAWWLGLADLKGVVKIKPGAPAAEVLKYFSKIGDEWDIRMDADRLVLPSGLTLIERLKALSDAGVDVRVLSWVSPFMSRYKIVAEQSPGIAMLNVQTLYSTARLRTIFGAKSDNVMLNLLAHPMGGAHLKVVVCGDANGMRAFTGGMDPQAGRLRATWHDLAVRVQGPAATGVYQFYRALWNEQRQRDVEVFTVGDMSIPSHLPTATDVPEREAPRVRDDLGQCVQVLRTVPQMKFTKTGPAWLNDNPVLRTLLVSATGFKKQPLSFAKDGIFEFKVALKQAISKAEKYIFIADQAFTSLELMDWLNQRLCDRPAVKVILLHGADPADPPGAELAEGFNRHLTAHLDPNLMGPPWFDNLVFCTWAGVAVHSKVVIVDDVWCAVGSANSMRRSLYTDIELSLSIYDSTMVKRLRRDLWARYCGIPLESEMPLIRDDRIDDILDLDRALGIWNLNWGDPKGLQLRPAITSSGSSMAVTTAFTEAQNNKVDPDSRIPF